MGTGEQGRLEQKTVKSEVRKDGFLDVILHGSVQDPTILGLFVFHLLNEVVLNHIRILEVHNSVSLVFIQKKFRSLLRLL